MRLYASLCLAAAMAWCPLSAAWGSGFALYEWSAAGNAMGGAGIAGGLGAQAMSANPASVTTVEDWDWSVGTSWVDPSGQVRFDDGSVWSNVRDVAVVPHGYYVRRLGENRWVGLGTFCRFGLSSKFAPDWPGRYDSYHASVESLSVTPTLGMRWGRLSMGVGLEAMRFSFEKGKKIALPTGDVDARIEADSWGWGWNMGLRWEMDDRTTVGAVYRSRVDQDVEGEARFTGVPDPLAQAGLFPQTSAWGSVTLPDSFALGISRWLSDRTRVELDGVYTRWSSYDSLTINYGAPLNPAVPGSSRTVEPKSWKDVWRYQIGVEHRLSRRWTAMAGFVYDRSPIPDGCVDFMVPTGDRRTYSLGLSYRGEDVTATVSYGYVDIDGRTVIYDSGGGAEASARVEDMASDVVGLTVHVRL